jgi:septum formation inhibitor-activating ATPase MinD
MEYAIGILKKQKDDLMSAEDITEVAKVFMLQTLEEAIRVLTFQRYDSAFVISENEKMSNALREIDTHIRCTPEPVPYIVNTLKETLPEYKDYPSTPGDKGGVL